MASQTPASDATRASRSTATATATMSSDRHEAETAPEAPSQTYADWARAVYREQYEAWMPWIEDTFLRYFTRDNKASFVAKENLDKTKVSGVQQVDQLQDGVHGLAAGQLGQDGLLRPVGDLLSREGLNRAERKGKGDDGGYLLRLPGL